ncbi:IPT/TIG domain-containing protein [Phycicoccus sp. MQZ13P-5]|uniref:alpha-amylase n=2 Tax=Phycicoccus sonneratiae TaxID=2807628 RepID=A0ABS2CLI3_9MICO|nr:IPT/TIG domain-containing protein [Phycicoccus sonneraticus]
MVTMVGATALATGTAVAVPVVLAAPAQADPTNTVSVRVTSARTEPHAPGGAVTAGQPVGDFRYMINVDDTGTSDPVGAPEPGSGCSAEDPGYPSECTWASLHEVTGAPIQRQGTSEDFANGATIDLPDGRYLISVLADGYKLDGVHFTVPTTDPVIDVTVQPNPLSDSTLRAFVFQDEASSNGAIDNGENGLKDFQGHINDVLGEVTTDVYGNPLCTRYKNENANYEIPWNAASRDADGNPIVQTVGGKCLSDADGMLVIPHLGTNRYTTYVTPPDGSDWVQTTTLEGNHDWDTWLLEGSTGYDTEFTLAGELVPTPQFGFVHPHNDIATSTATGSIKGTVVGVKQYYPPVGGSFNQYWGSVGSKLDKPIPNAVLSLNDLGNGDQSIWAGRAAADGTFTIPHVPDGTYMLTWWDEPQNYILQLVNVTVSGGKAVDLKQLPLNGWWTPLTGHVFLDNNKNGKRDPGEAGVAQFPLTLRKKDNSLMDRGSTAASTDSTGYFEFPSAYPLAEWLIMEAYSDNFYTTGVTYQTDNQPTPTTVLGSGVDVSILPIIGLSGRVDWGVQKYDPTGTKGGPRNGGIVGSVSYDTTRNELDPRYAATEDWQPGISGVPVKLYAPVTCGTTSAPCDATDTYELAPDGSYAKGRLLNSYVSEHWSRPTGCTARDVDGKPFTHGTEENVLVTNQETDGECISALIQGVQVGTYASGQGTPDAGFGASVDGNYGFGDGCTGTLDASDPSDPQCTGGSFAPLGAGDYLVSVEIPEDPTGKPMYQVTREEDINIGRGDQVVPQAPPAACVGALHTVDVEGRGTDGYGEKVGPVAGVPAGVTVGASTPVHNPTFADIGGSPYEGTVRPECDTKLVPLANGKSIVPMFHLFTDVPIPSRLRGLIVDDLNYSTDNRSVLYGDKAGVPNAPVGIYDFANDLKYTAHSDFNGYYDVLMPSTDHINCPTPSGVCQNMYRFVGNDPGVPGALNADYNPRFRTIGTEFEATPGVTIPTDLAPTQVGVSLGTPGSSPTTVKCMPNLARPQLFSVDQPFMRSATSGAARSVTITGYGFGDTKGTGAVRLGTTVLTTTTWTNTRIVATIPAVGTATGQLAAGPYDLSVTSGNGLRTTNGLTYHQLGSAYNPTVLQVGPGVSNPQYDPTKAASQRPGSLVRHPIQNAIDDARASAATDLVVVMPNTPSAGNPRGAYYENLVVSGPLKLQGVGAGGFQGTDTNAPYVQGTVIDGSAFGGDTDLATDWFTKVGAMTWSGNQTVSDGAVVYLLGKAPGATATAAEYSTAANAFKPSIDGFDLRGGDQQGFPGNINDLTGQVTGLPPNIVTQGGAVFANAYVRQLQVTNNVVENNGGGYGTIRVGTPDLTGTDANQHNEKVRIANNRILQNAGTNLAGAIGLFGGSDGYEVAGNDVCGNFSLEYGAGLSVYGYSPGGSVHDNRFTLNNSNDEGAGIMMAGALQADPDVLSPGTGAVDIYANEIKGNLANDDGGGIRFLMAGNYPMNVHDNVIASNVSTHEGGGIAINDAPDVRIYSNTIMDNITTATAVTSTGLPAPAGVSTSENSQQLQATLPAGSPAFSRPALFDNVLWDNRAGTRAGTTVSGIGLGGASDVEPWDVGVADFPGVLAPLNSVIQQDASVHPYTQDASNRSSDPKVVEPWTVSVSFATWRQNPAFVDATVVAVEKPADLLGNYHLASCAAGGSPACDLGVMSRGGITVSSRDIDGDARPNGPLPDAGADEAAYVAPPPPPVAFLFSTAGTGTIAGVSGTVDDSDVIRYDGATNAYSRVVRAQANPGPRIPAAANVDGFASVDATHWYMSFTTDVTLPGVGTVQDEDVVYWNGSAWSVWFDGTARGLTSAALDITSIGVRGGSLYFSTTGVANPPGVSGTADNSDVYQWNGSVFARVWDASTKGVPTAAVVDGAVFDSATHGWYSFGADTTLPGIGAVQDEDIVEYSNGTWSVWFNGTAHGLTPAGLDIDAFSMPDSAPAPAPLAAPARQAQAPTTPTPVRMTRGQR